MNRKPIFIIRTPHFSNDADRTEFNEMMNKELADSYHLLIFDSADEDTFKFQMFSDHEIEPIELEKLKKLVK